MLWLSSHVLNCLPTISVILPDLNTISSREIMSYFRSIHNPFDYDAFVVPQLEKSVLPDVFGITGKFLPDPRYQRTKQPAAVIRNVSASRLN